MNAKSELTTSSVEDAPSVRSVKNWFEVEVEIAPGVWMVSFDSERYQSQKDARHFWQSAKQPWRIVSVVVSREVVP